MFWAIVFNPSFAYRLAHMALGACHSTTFVVAGGVGRHLLRDHKTTATQRMFFFVMWMAIIATPTQIIAADVHGLSTPRHHPARVMAMKGHFDSHPAGAPLILFVLPNTAEMRMDCAVQIPNLSRLILQQDLNPAVAGLGTIAPEDQPPVAIVFFSCREMIGLGFAMLGVSLWALWLGAGCGVARAVGIAWTVRGQFYRHRDRLLPPHRAALPDHQGGRRLPTAAPPFALVDTVALIPMIIAHTA